MSALLGVPEDAVYHLVLALTSVFTPVLGALGAVAGIAVLTIAVRLTVSPLTFRALRGQAAQARLAPRAAELRQRFKNEPERLQRELVALYQSEGVSLLAGVWPMLVQWPVFSVLYLLFRSPTVAGGPNLLLTHRIFGVPLGSYLLSGAPSSARTVPCSSECSRFWRAPAGSRPAPPAALCRPPRRRPRAPWPASCPTSRWRSRRSSRSSRPST